MNMMDIPQMALTICESIEADFDKFAATVPDGVPWDDEKRRYYKLGMDIGVMKTLKWLIDNGVLVGHEEGSAGQLLRDAADEIEKLRREIDLLRQGLAFEKRIKPEDK